MSTEFRTADTDEWVGVRWGKGPVGCTGFDWGANHDRPFAFHQARPDVVDEAGGRWTWEEFRTQVLEAPTCTWTFGEFGGTMEVGSGDIATWEGL